ncbi:Nuclease sbcCD subunit D [Pantoea agglomerans]|uniref:Nuclease SbcCD subunit D n=1 Tax=Enterobacter agglomerans TaxID=549 RepID=A0A379AJQ5_ENTAG|nr:Nuclease sbcCD subunit D [Pantoea agglomerans]
MRIIHTADWHLGQFFYNKSRAAEHQAFLDWLLIQIEQHQVDALIIAGDLFDTGTPPSYAREMFNRFVVALQPSGCQLIVLAGNHDSVATLNESRELLACLNTRVIATPGRRRMMCCCSTPRQGEPGALLCAIPYLRPRDILRSRAGQSGRDKQTSLLEAIAHPLSAAIHRRPGAGPCTADYRHRPSHHRRRQPERFGGATSISGRWMPSRPARFPRLTISHWGIFIAPSASRAASISATAAHRFR